jgi:hypothetical protein
MPALPLDEAGKYVAAAYLVFLALVVLYVAIMGVRLARLEREVAELDELTPDPQDTAPVARQQPSEVIR